MREYVDSIIVAAEALLEKINEVYLDADLDPVYFLPNRQYVTGGTNTEIVHECEQVVVAIEQAYSGPPGAQVSDPSGCEGPRSIVLTVEVVRCQPLPTTGRGGASVVSPERYTAAARTQAIDMYLLMDAGLLFAESDFNDRPLGLGGLVTTNIGPESGGYQAVILEVVTTL